MGIRLGCKLLLQKLIQIKWIWYQIRHLVAHFLHGRIIGPEHQEIYAQQLNGNGTIRGEALAHL